ncbi:LOW QUALITY PROTEIN: Lanosterol 14-alpha demethylase, partial [Galemys pyrenaicus]
GRGHLDRPFAGLSCSIESEERRRPRPPASSANSCGGGMVFLGLLQAGGLVLGEAMEQVTGGSVLSTLLVACAFTLSLVYLFRLAANHLAPLPAGAKSPPYIFSPIPFLGHAIAFGKSPIEFLENAYEKYGPVFSFTMVGKTFTYLVGSDAAALFFNSKNEDLNAEDVYSRLTTPVFGKGVAYDVPNPVSDTVNLDERQISTIIIINVFLEQKKMLKSGLNIAHFRQHVSIIEKETKAYFQSWGESGEKNLFEALSELIILTASHCLHGKEIRSQLNEKVAQLYADLDGGFSHAAWLLPGWLPLPSFRRRDRAHREIKNIFYKAIQKRKQSEEKVDDILQTLLDSTYKDGRPLTDDEVAGMLIGLLLAGQHTSSTTSAWMGFFLARDKTLQKNCYLEQKAVCGEDLPPLNFDQLKDLNLLDRCIKETLRLRPPILTMMRMARTPQTVAGYTIPPGHQVCVSPTVNQRLKDSWVNRLDFNPDRYLQDSPVSGEKFAYVPFGAGRHRCIGENFAYVQIKTIWSTMLRLFEFDLIDGYFPTVNFTTMIHTPENPVIRYKQRSK